MPEKLIKELDLNGDQKVGDGKFEVFGIQSILHLATVTLFISDINRMGKYNNLEINLNTYNNGIKMHLDGESMNLYGDVKISVKPFYQINMRFADLTYY